MTTFQHYFSGFSGRGSNFVALDQKNGPFFWSAGQCRHPRKRCTPLRTTKELLNDGCGRQVVPLTGISDAQITTSRSSPTLHNPRSLAHLCYPVPPAVGVPCPRPAVESRSEPDESYSRYEFTYSQHYPYSELLPMPEDPFNVGLVKRPSKS